MISSRLCRYSMAARAVDADDLPDENDAMAVDGLVQYGTGLRLQLMP